MIRKRITALALVLVLAVCVVIPLVQGAFAADKQPRAVEATYTVTPVYREAIAEPREINTRPFTAEEEIMLAKLVWGEARGVTGEKWGVSGKARQAAVIWCVLNRVDAWGGTIAETVTAPSQFAYDPEAPVEMELLNLAYDVLCRWEEEKEGQTQVGRTLPKEYRYFGAEHGENYFRTDYFVLGDNWDWSLGDPYK